MELKDFPPENPKSSLKFFMNKNTTCSDAIIKKVFHSLDSDKTIIYALKSINACNTNLIKSLKQEAKILEKISHENIIKYYGCCFNEKENFIILEWMDVDLQKLINAKLLHNQVFQKQEIENLMRCLLSGLFYLRANRIFHGDLKPSNVLFKENMYKLADFGNAVNFSDKKENISGSYYLGTPNFWPPEFRESFLSNDANTEFNVFKVDSFMLALIILYMIFLRTPSESYSMLKDKRKKQFLFLEIEKKMGIGVKKIIKKLVCFDYKKRESVLMVILNYSQEYKYLIKKIVSDQLDLKKKILVKFEIMEKIEKGNNFIVKMLGKNNKFIMTLKENITEDEVFSKLNFFNFIKGNQVLNYKYYDISKLEGEHYLLILFAEIDNKQSLYQEIFKRRKENAFFSLEDLMNFMFEITQVILEMKLKTKNIIIWLDLHNIFKDEMTHKYFLLFVDSNTKENEIFSLGLCLLSLSTLKIVERNEELEKLNKELFFFNETNVDFILQTYGEYLMSMLLELIKFNEKKRISLLDLMSKLLEHKNLIKFREKLAFAEKC